MRVARQRRRQRRVQRADELPQPNPSAARGEERGRDGRLRRIGPAAARVARKRREVRSAAPPGRPGRRVDGPAQPRRRPARGFIPRTPGAANALQRQHRRRGVRFIVALPLSRTRHQRERVRQAGPGDGRRRRRHVPRRVSRLRVHAPRHVARRPLPRRAHHPARAHGGAHAARGFGDVREEPALLPFHRSVEGVEIGRF